MVRFACIYLPGYLQVIGYNFKVKLASLIINYVPSNIYSQKSPSDGLVWFMVFNATFNNISVISWWSVLLVEETGIPREN